METIYIYNGASRLTIPVTDSAERSHSLQQHNYVKLVWKSAENTPISANAYIEYEGQVFYALDDYFPTHKDGIYEYDIEFHAIEDTFNRPLFFRYVEVTDQTTGETTSWKEIEWSLNGNLKTIADIVITCLNRAYDNAYFELPADSYTDTLLMSYSFSGNSIADALSTIAEQNETEWWIETTTEYANGKHKYILHFDKCEIGTTIELNDHYIEDANGVWQSGGLKSVSQSGNTNIIPQKLFVYGSERNIIKKTVEEETEGGKMNVSYDKKLRLPSSFPNGTKEHVIESAGVTLSLNDDSSISIGGINNHFEQVKIFDEVYPKMDMEVTAVSVQNPNSENPIYWLKGDRLKSITTESPVDGSINPGKLGLLIEGCTLMCTFTSGLLNGREFECAWRESSAEIGLIPIDENDVQIPSGVFKPQEGDTFILWNLAMPQSSITIAQNELCIEAINYIEELATSITETDCVSEPEAFRLAGYDKQIQVGQRITVGSNVFRNGKLASRIIKFSYKLTKPYDISFTLASSRQTGRLATLENMIADVTHEVHATGQVQRAISRRQWHDTEEMMSMLDSIQKQLVVVGDENNSFTTTCNLEYSDVTKILTISKGYLQHQSFTDNEWKGAWLIEQDKTISMPALDEKGVTPFYVYFVCSKNNNLGYVEVGSGLPQYNDNYVFLLGILSSEFEGKRVFNQSSGLTSIAGGTITTDVVQDPGRRLIIDYSNATITARNGATIKGAIQFEKGDGENDLGTALDDLFNGVQGAQDSADEANDKADKAQNAIDNLEVGGTNLISNLAKNWEVGSFNESKPIGTNWQECKYANGTSKAIRTKELVEVSGNIITSINEDYVVSFMAFDENKNYVGKDLGYHSSVANRPIKLDDSIKYIWVIISKKDITTTGNIEYITEAKLKIEKGTIATDWTPAPEDVEQAIVDAEDRMGESLASAVETINGGIDALQKQVDGEVNSWFMEGEPTLNNAPANEWTTDELKQRHEGDTYTDISEITLLGSWLWEQGTINWNNGNTINSDIAIRTIDFIVNKGGTLYVPSGYNMNIHYYDNEYKWQTKAGAEVNYTLLTDYPYIKLRLQTKDNSSILPSIADELKLSINPTSGQSWRWCNCTYTDESGTSITGWHWHKIADSDAVKALAEAAKAQSTADGKSTTFIVQPSNYSKGDLWILASDTTVNGTSYKAGTILTANEASATYVASHWGEKVKYTDDELAKKAEQDAANAQEKADQAQTDATNAKNRLDNWASDSVISPTEKQGIKDEIARIVADKSHIESEYTKYSLGTPTTFNTAYTAYYNVLTTLSATEPETITIPADFATKQTTYYTARTNALNAISEGAKLYAESYADYVSEYEKLKGVNLCSYKKILDSGFTYASELQSDGSFKVSHHTLYTETLNNSYKDMFGMEGEYLENTQYTITQYDITTNGTGDTLYFRIDYIDGYTNSYSTPANSTYYSFTTLINKTIKSISGSYSSGGYTIAQIKLEVGSEATSYNIPIEDELYQANASITAVSEDIKDVDKQVHDAFSDGSLSKAEQKAIQTSLGELENSYNAFIKEYTDVANSEHLDNTSVTIGENSYPTPEDTLTSAYSELTTAYNNYHGVIKGIADVEFKVDATSITEGALEYYIPYTDSRLTSIGIANRESYLATYSEKVTAYKQALSVAQENIRVNMQKASEKYADKKIGEIEVGGTNLLRKSADILFTKWNGTATYSSTNTNGINMVTYDSDGYLGLYKSLSSSIFPYDIKGNITISLLFRVSSTQKRNLYFVIRGKKTNDETSFTNIFTKSTTYTDYTPNTWHKLVLTFELTDTISNVLAEYPIQQGAYVIINQSQSNTTTAGNTIEIKNVKIEQGNIATEWTPAPEDIDAEIAEAKKEAQDVSIALNDTDSLLNKSLSDGYIDANEKEALNKALATLEVEYTEFTNEYNDIYSSPYLTNEQKGILDEKYRAFVDAYAIYKESVNTILSTSISGLSLVKPKIQISNWSDDKYKTPKATYETSFTNLVSAISTAQEQMRVNLNAESERLAKEAVKDLQIGGVNLVSNIPQNWEKKSWNENASTGTLWGSMLYNSAKIIRIKQVIPASGTITISHNEGYRVAIFQFDENKGYLGKTNGYSGWLSTTDNPLTQITIKLNNATRYIACGVTLLDVTSITDLPLNTIYDVKLQIEQGNKATAYKPNDADIIEARENIIREGMMVTLGAGTEQFTLNLTKSLSSNTEYVFSIERASMERDIDLYYGSTKLVRVDTITNSAKYFVFTTPSSISSGTTITLSYQENQGTTTILTGVKLAEGNKYVGYEATPEEKDAIMALQTAMKGSTDIIGGLMLTNLIGMKGEDSTINAGISGLEDWNNLRFWAGSSWAGASTAPFRVYDDGRVFGTHFYGFFSAFEVNTSNINSVSSTSDSYKKLNLNVTGSNILLNYSSAYVTLPSDIKYVGSEVQIYNPNRYSIPTCNFVPYYSQCTIKNYEQTVSLTRTSYLGAISVSTTGGVVPTSISVPRWSVQMNTCSNYKPAYVKFRAVKTTLSLVSGYNVYVPYWLKNCLYSGSISNTASYPFGDSQAYYLVNSTCTFVIWIMVEYSTTMS